MPLLKLPSGVSLSYFSYPDPAPLPSHPTVLFLSALIQRTEVQFEPQYKDPLFKGFNFVGIDVHGHGDTTGRETWDYADNAADVVEGMKALGIDKFFVFGTSSGGMITQEIGIRYPEHVRGLVLCATTPGPISPEFASRFRSFWLPAWNSSVPPPDAALMGSTASSFGVAPKPADQPGSAFGDRNPVEHESGERTAESAIGLELYCRILDNWRSHTGESKVMKPVEAMLRWEGTGKRLGGVEVPVLVLHGRDDPTFSIDHAEQISKSLPSHKHNRLVKLDGNGAHVINVIKEVVPVLNSATREWLDECIKAGF